MPSLPSPRRTLAPLAAALAVAGAGCVQQDPPGLKITALEATITFGLKPPAAATPPGVDPPLQPVSAPPLAPSQPSSAPTVEDVLEAPPLPPIVPKPRAPRPKPLCPTAGAGEFPEPATNEVLEPPTAGAYVWRPGPPVLRDAAEFPVKQEDLFARVIFDVTKPTTSTIPGTPAAGQRTITTFTYKVATYRGSEVVVDAFRVVNGGISDSAGAVNAGPQVYFGQPDRGVSLVSRVVGRGGRVVARFNPSTPLLLLPLPIESGSTFQTAAVDPTSGATQLLYGQVTKRAAVDACGEEVDGWVVSAQTAFRDPAEGPAAQPRTTSYTYTIATGEGGILISETVSPLALPQFPVNGTPADGALPPNPDVPALPTAAAGSQISLASPTAVPLDPKGLPKDELVPGLGD